MQWTLTLGWSTTVQLVFSLTGLDSLLSVVTSKTTYFLVWSKPDLVKLETSCRHSDPSPYGQSSSVHACTNYSIGITSDRWRRGFEKRSSRSCLVISSFKGRRNRMSRKSISWRTSCQRRRVFPRRRRSISRITDPIRWSSLVTEIWWVTYLKARLHYDTLGLAIWSFKEFYHVHTTG